jgi:hypothetical protein
MGNEPQFRMAVESDAGILLRFMREYYAFDGHGFEEHKAHVALVTLLQIAQDFSKSVANRAAPALGSVGRFCYAFPAGFQVAFPLAFVRFSYSHPKPIASEGPTSSRRFACIESWSEPGASWHFC